MRDCDNLTEISVENENGETIVEYFANSIPRIGEDISFRNNIYRVYNVRHRIVEHENDSTGTYVIIDVELLI
jgi:translation elongation factor EF-Ts